MNPNVAAMMERQATVTILPMQVPEHLIDSSRFLGLSCVEAFADLGCFTRM